MRLPFLLLAALALNVEGIRWFGSTKPARTSLSQVRKSRKHTFRVIAADGEAKDFLKKRGETLQHVLGKAVIWSLYKETYPELEVEDDIGDEKLPDCIAVRGGEPVFWGESGRMSVEKAVGLAERFPDTHLVHLKWGDMLADFAPEVRKVMKARGVQRSAAFEFGTLPYDCWRFLDDEGRLRITRDDVVWCEADA